MSAVRLTLLAILLTLCSGCGQHAPLRIASKTSMENQILAEMFILLANARGVPVKRLVPYGNTFDVQEAIKEGRIDLYPEYTGTGASMMGLPVMRNSKKSLMAVRNAFQPYGLRWLDPLGFDNAYALVMTTDRAARLGVRSISDLARLDQPIRLACEAEYLSRPVDGLAALQRHYGWVKKPKVVTADSRETLYQRLIAERADVAVVHRTDPQISEFGLVVLTDDLSFFPAYQAAPLVRAETLQRWPALERTLSELTGRLDDAWIRALNRRVELDGFEPRAVAVDFLVRQGLLSKEPPQLDQPTAIVATPQLDHRSATLVRALAAVRRALPNRRVELESFDDPAGAVHRGEAFVAALGAEHFFAARGNRLPQLRSGIEAVAPVAHRMAHLLRPAGAPQGASARPFENIQRLGVGPERGSASHAAKILLDAYGVAEDVRLVYGDAAAQADSVATGSLDALLLLVTPGDAQPMLLLRDHALRLRPVGGWADADRRFRYPFLRPARIPAETYRGLDEPVETISAQLVLAGPRSVAPMIGDGDPMTGLRTRRPPIPLPLKRAMVKALDQSEGIDPSLPGSTPDLGGNRRDARPLNPDPALSVLNAVVLTALVIFLYVITRRGRNATS